MGSVDRNEEMAQPYTVEQKQVKKCYVKFFKWLLNVAVHNTSSIYCTRKDTQPALQADLIKAPFLTHKPQVAFPTGPGRQSLDHPPGRLVGRHFIEGSCYRQNESPKEEVLFVRYRRRRSRFIGVMTAE